MITNEKDKPADDLEAARIAAELLVTTRASYAVAEQIQAMGHLPLFITVPSSIAPYHCDTHGTQCIVIVLLVFDCGERDPVQLVERLHALPDAELEAAACEQWVIHFGPPNLKQMSITRHERKPA